ncbi:hypothetical protein CO180_00715 [candidate division WWE3 bacterium CG_4_9_14_3_um_filter_41_6]|uniref:Tryptophan synthase beta chain-like PALP domain-containing protein n=1 Tax=candidate division WWE3 bacterium CG_4_10_14_0_2_um_filter_41_14 TaxID=1975072 RepID=A0A2M7THS7_UNCKA|nr:MAG: hypothetical protein COY32_04775 [candidate division WWE3 bacterium CG_4_10_14_0_2_um_filter_41_14]PJA39472.1 MAG: hypothetical protein CO180_00715 [candidate division WWE3 bacterium CG_4_9_14_3_um_filter_41_6]
MDAQAFYSVFIKDWPQTPLSFYDGVYFKCEFCNVTGSIKSRGVCWQIYELLKAGINEIVVSSSGNAGVAYAYYCQKAGIICHVFVPKSIDPIRLSRMQKITDTITVTDNTMHSAAVFATTKKVPYIQQSTDSMATYGYQGLYDELAEQLKVDDINLYDTSVFFPVSSGTTVEGFYRGSLESTPQKLPQIHIVQSQSVHPLAQEFDQRVKRKARSVVSGIVSRASDRAEVVLGAVRESKGSGWVIVDDGVLAAHQRLVAMFQDKPQSTISLEGALAYAGYLKAKERGFDLRPHSIVMLT